MVKTHKEIVFIVCKCIFWVPHILHIHLTLHIAHSHRSHETDNNFVSVSFNKVKNAAKNHHHYQLYQMRRGLIYFCETANIIPYIKLLYRLEFRFRYFSNHFFYICYVMYQCKINWLNHIEQVQKRPIFRLLSNLPDRKPSKVLNRLWFCAKNTETTKRDTKKRSADNRRWQRLRAQCMYRRWRIITIFESYFVDIAWYLSVLLLLTRAAICHW